MTARLYARSPDASASTVGDRVVLYHRTSRAALVLNPTGSVIWEQLSVPQTSDALAASLRARFPTLTVEQSQHDVDAFLADLVRHAMVAAAS